MIKKITICATMFVLSLSLFACSSENKAESDFDKNTSANVEQQESSSSRSREVLVPVGSYENSENTDVLSLRQILGDDIADRGIESLDKDYLSIIDIADNFGYKKYDGNGKIEFSSSFVISAGVGSPFTIGVSNKDNSICVLANGEIEQMNNVDKEHIYVVVDPTTGEDADFSMIFGR